MPPVLADRPNKRAASVKLRPYRSPIKHLFSKTPNVPGASSNGGAKVRV